MWGYNPRLNQPVDSGPRGKGRSLAPRTLIIVIALLGTLLALAGSTPANANEDSAPNAGPVAVFPDEWHTMNTGQAVEARARLVGKKTPGLQVEAWANGKPGKGEFHGKIVLIDFWGTWCRPCIAAIPHTNEIMDKYADQGVRVMGVCDSNRGELMQQFVDEHDIRYPTARDIQSRTVRRWSVPYFPYYVLVDRKGMVRAAGLRPDRLDAAIDALLAEQPYDGVSGSAPSGE